MLQVHPEQTGFFMARQPICDREGKHIAYELLYRKSDTAFCSEITSLDEVISLSNVLMEVGIDRLAGDLRAFINVPECMLSTEALRLLPSQKVTLDSVPFNAFFADGNDATLGNTNIGNVIKHRFGIDDRPVVNDEVVVLGKGRRNGEKACC